MSLDERGHRAKSGKPWSHISVLSVLRNRTYLGEVYFRDKHHPGPHRALLDSNTFQAAQALLRERGDDHSNRRTNTSDYLLGGLVICEACGHHFVGTAAIGNRYRYRYYTCYTRERYGKNACSSERLPADELDRAVLASLLETYEREDLIATAVADASARLNAARPGHREQLAADEAEIKNAEAAMDRYFHAFESSAMSEVTCGRRVEALAERVRELYPRQAELRGAA